MAQINLEDLLHKTENQGATDAGRLTAAEWNKLVQAVMANQGAVKKITFNSRDYLPDENGTVTMTILDSGVSYVVQLDTLSDQDNIISTDERVKLRMRFLSQSYNQITQALTDTHEDGTALVQFKAANSDTWQDGGTVNIASVPMEDEDAYEELDITNMIPSGASQVRVKVTGNTTMLETTYVVFSNVVKTVIGISFANEWRLPVTGGRLPLLFYVRGNVGKTLNLKISGQGGIRQYLASSNTGIPLGTSIYTERPYQYDVIDTAADTVKVMTHGVHSVEAWLTVNGTDIESEHVKLNLMVASDDEDDSPYLIVNDILTQVDNFTNNRLFRYAVYSPADTGVTVRFAFGDYNQTVTYLESTVLAQPGQVYDFNNVLEIDSDHSSVTAYLRAYSGESQLITPVSIAVDNSQNFAPVDGADLFINPKLRTNADGSPASILNAADGNAVVPSQFNGFGFITDGWVSDANGRPCLRVPSGRSLGIDYEAYSDFMGESQTGSLTIELDFAVHNVVDEDSPVLRMCSYSSVDDRPLGLEIKPLKAVFMTLGKRTESNQDTSWGEGERIHLAVNILYNLNASGINYIRIFLNGKIQREIDYATNDTFVQYVDGVKTSEGIRIGSAGADMDIYGLRIYKMALSATEICQNRLSSLDTGPEKMTFRNDNDILDDAGNVSYDKVRLKGLNYIVWHGRYATYGNTKNDKFQGNLDVHLAGDPAHSGTLYYMEEGGQGTSSMLYFRWNGQWKFLSNGYWVNELGENKGAKYQMAADIPAAKKLAGKLNYASSMQSHKMGSCNMYDDLQKAVVGGHSVNSVEGYQNVRTTVKQLPFYFFVQEDDISPVFHGLMTFGPAKGDKPTFGIDNDVFQDTLIIEGADNDMPLLMHRIPWIAGDVVLDGEDWKYNGVKQLSLVGGNTDAVSYFIAAFNFNYLHYDRLEAYEGTYEQLVADADSLDISKHYWVTVASDGAAVADVFRYDDLTDSWVPAGATKTDSGYGRLNLFTQTNSAADYSGNAIEDNAMFKAKRLADFKTHVGDYFDITDTCFTMNFCRLVAASDNRGKNLYYYLDYSTHKIGWCQDDLDTILDTNNVGQSEKPYYVEVHDQRPEGGFYWNSEGNSFFNNMENAFASELRSEMLRLLSAMATLAGGTPLDCVKRYYTVIQDYFCAAAYNETARLLYENAQKALKEGTYTNGTEPITQSRGDQKHNELQWWTRRIAYLSSYAQYGEFGCADGGRSAGSLNFRSILQLNGSRPNYSFALKPHIWLYPSAAIGQSLSIGSGNTQPVRCQAGQNVTLNAGSSDGNTNVFLEGIDWYREIGNFADKSLNGNFNLSGVRLQKFEAVAASGELMQFRPASMTITAPNLQRLVLNGVSTLSGNLDLSALTRLQYLDLRGTNVSSVTLPSSEYLTEVHLPASLTALTIDGVINLTTISIEGAENLQTVIIRNMGDEGSYSIVEALYRLGNVPAVLTCNGIEWLQADVNVLSWLTDIPNSNVTGHIVCLGQVSFSLKQKLIARWGNVDDEDNAVHVVYESRPLASIAVTGLRNIISTGSVQYNLSTVGEGNDVQSVTWSLSSNASGVATISQTGLLEVTSIPAEHTDIIITCSVLKSNGTTLTANRTVSLYEHVRAVGDYVYADGTWSNELQPDKTLVGICYWVKDDLSMGLCVAAEALLDSVWGLSSSSVSGITLGDEENAGYSVYDTPVANTTCALGAVTQLIESFDEFVRGDQILTAMYNTRLIIHHRDRILSDSNIDLAQYIPERYAQEHNISPHDAVAACLNAITGLDLSSQYLYLAATRCHAYAPLVRGGEELADKFKAGHWFLPGTGDLTEIYKYHHAGYTSGVQDAIFADAKIANRFTALKSANTWSWCENYATSAYYVNLSTGQVNSNNKSTSYQVRPVAAF